LKKTVVETYCQRAEAGKRGKKDGKKVWRYNQCDLSTDLIRRNPLDVFRIEDVIIAPVHVTY